MLREYYNPLGFFDEVYVLSPFETKTRYKWGMYIDHSPVMELGNRIREIKPHIVRAYGGYHSCDMAVLNRVEGIPIICSIHDTNLAFIHDSVKYADYVWVKLEKKKQKKAIDFLSYINFLSACELCYWEHNWRIYSIESNFHVFKSS